MLGFLAVALGAMGAHLLKAPLEAHGTLEIWKTAALYHLTHAVLLVFLATRLYAAPSSQDLLYERKNLLHVAAWLFVCGVLIFSGSLYTLALTNVRAWGAVTPFGGLALMGGWICLALSVKGPPRK